MQMDVLGHHQTAKREEEEVRALGKTVDSKRSSQRPICLRLHPASHAAPLSGVAKRMNENE